MHLCGINAFKIFSCRILIISCKTLIITVIFNEKPIEITIYVKLSRNGAILYRQELASFFSFAEKIKSVPEFKINFFE